MSNTKPVDSACNAESGAGDVSGHPENPHAPAVETAEVGAPLLTLLPVAAVVLLLDQLTKIWAVERLDNGRTIDLFWTLRFKLVRNEGAAFSQGESLTPLIAVASIAVAIGVIVVGRRMHRRSVLIALGLVLGGALGNVIDRLFREGDGVLRGAVVDFIDLQWWPVFNVADMGIVVGGLLLVLLLSESRT